MEDIEAKKRESLRKLARRPETILNRLPVGVEKTTKEIASIFPPEIISYSWVWKELNRLKKAGVLDYREANKETFWFRI